MSSPTFTPGDWRIEKNKRGEKTIWAGYGTEARLIVPAGDELEQKYFLSMLTQEEHEANANLIAAAPEMYEALKRIINELPTNRDWLDPDLEKLAKDAIAKAEGREAR